MRCLSSSDLVLIYLSLFTLVSSLYLVVTKSQVSGHGTRWGTVSQLLGPGERYMWCKESLLQRKDAKA